MRTLSRTSTRRRPSRARHQRGTVLLMVVGVLALISIVAILYGAIGQADRRSSAAYVRAVTLDDQASKIGEYLNGIIRNSTFNVIRETDYGSWAPPGGRAMRVTWGYSSVDTAMRTDPLVGPGTDPVSGRAVIRYSPLGGAETPWLAPTDPVWLGTSTNNDASGLRPYVNQHDWDSITNIAPDGRFVNLANLRNNFDAEPGVGVDVYGRPRMSRGLTLFGFTGLPYNTTGTVLLDDNTTVADPNIPWHWTRRQRWAYRPIREIGFGTANNAQDEYYPNQWADADGDGMGDSRWFELSDATLPAEAKSVLPAQRARYFAAVRIVDLSGRINVNTATASGTTAAAPDKLRPLGYTPADWDLSRLLGLGDVFAAYCHPTLDQAVGYDGLEQPRIPAGPQPPSHYGTYSTDFVAAAVGAGAYSALRATINDGFVPAGALPPVAPVNAAQRADYYNTFAFDLAGARRYTAGADRSGTLSPLGLGDAAELLTFERTNDSKRTTTLEAATGGRVPGIGTVNLDPLRSNRPIVVERGGRSRMVAGNPNGFPDDDALLGAAIDLRHRIIPIDGGARPFTSIVSPWHARVIGNSPNLLYQDEVRVNPLTLLHYPGAVPSPAEVGTYFRHIADCLMPYRDDDPNGSPSWDDTVVKNIPLTYGGRGMELAYRLAAHLTVNTVAAMHPSAPEAEPRAYSLVVDPTFPGGVPAYAWFPPLKYTQPPPTPPPPPSPPQDADRELKDSTSPPLRSSSYVNLFGVGAQPFIVEVSSFTFYIDMPHSADPGSADDEYADAVPPAVGPVTIDGTVSSANSDYLAEVLAFQLTNPFDRDIVLTRAVDENRDGNADLLYYIEYATQYFQLARLDDTAGRVHAYMEEIRIPAGQTRVFYATSPRTLAQANARFLEVNGAANPPTPPVPTNFVQQWAAARFGPGAVHIPMVNVNNTGVIGAGAGGIMNLHKYPASLAGREKVVYLWRAMRTAPLDLDPATTPNDPDNDYLADRLHDPSTGLTTILRQRIPVGNTDIPGTQAGDDNDSFAGDDQDNTGFNMILWGAVRRPTATFTPLGAMPPWCIEAKLDQQPAYNGGNGYNLAENGPTSDVGSDTEYGQAGLARYQTMRAMIDDQLAAGSPAVNPQIGRAPHLKTGNPIGLSRYALPSGTAATFNQQAIEIHIGDPSTSTAPPNNNGLFRRTGDLLLPLAIGPWNDPTRPPPLSATPLTGYVGNLEGQWTTLGETLALAMDYYSPTDPNDLFYQVAHRDAAAVAGTLSPALDRGNLVLDNFVPYVDGPAPTGNGMFDGDDRPLGLGIPLALNILDKFRMDDYGSLARSQPGRLNINTAPTFNLQAHPLLSTDPNPAGWPTAAGLFSPMTETQDGAALLVAYRDKLPLLTRRLATASAPVAGDPLDFRDLNDGVDGVNNALDDNGRRYATLIPALREDQGFRSIGEILATSIHQPAFAAIPLADDNLDRFAYDAVSINHQGVDTPLWRDASNVLQNDNIPNEYDEKLAVANSLLSMITVRSDIFCAWFVVHGYLPSDVAVGPDGNTPMVPSIARRYMMVIDRSNVVRPTDKPRILLMQEVPM